VFAVALSLRLSKAPSRGRGTRMPFKPWVRNISPLGWCLGASAVANVVTMAAVLYLAFGTPKVFVRDGYINASIGGKIDVNDYTPLRVFVVP
jgi:hypothetical protein